MVLKRKFRYAYDYLRYHYYPINIHKKKIAKTGFELRGKYLVATTRGLFLINNDNIFLLIPGNCYGITIDHDQIYLYQNFGFRGRIVSINFDKEGNLRTKGRLLISALPQGCHQIDMVGENLYITDTYNNRIIACHLKEQIKRYFYPLGRLDNGRNSDNYAHINSLYYSQKEKGFYLFCHNETLKTGRKSSILFVNHQFEKQRQIFTQAVNGHNICKMGNHLLYCDSENKALIRDDEVVFNTRFYTRGLSIGREYILIGGSEFRTRKKRSKSKGNISVTDKDFKLIHSFEFPGPVQEIRRLDGIDYGLSQFQPGSFNL